MKFYILTLFPDFFESFLNTSIIKRAVEGKFIEIQRINIRDFSKDKHHNTDDYPYGGGPGMVMTPQPLADSIKYVKSMSPEAKVFYFSPHGETFNQKMVNTFSQEQELILLCGHYEGIDHRIVEQYVDMEISIGDFILTGGELVSMVFIDALSRLVKGVLGNDESASDESFSNDLLEYPHYTRPSVFEGLEVPEILLSGHHENIKKWRMTKSIEITRAKRPDLINKTSKKP
ncbi:MAG: tRNA (guanosine(37)-N1)-methyltransferase TrmD [Eubacteriales bacterium]